VARFGAVDGKGDAIELAALRRAEEPDAGIHRPPAAHDIDRRRAGSGEPHRLDPAREARRRETGAAHDLHLCAAPVAAG